MLKVCGMIEKEKEFILGLKTIMYTMKLHFYKKLTLICKLRLKWNHEWHGKTYYSHSTTHSCGVLTHIGKNVEFNLKDKVIDDNVRFIILLCEVQGSECLLVNIYAPNTEYQQLIFLSELEECISALQVSASTLIIWGGDFNCHFSELDAEGGRCIPKKLSINKIESIMPENDLCDIWRLQNENTRQYTWRSFNPLVQRRLDYYLVSNHLQPLVTSSKICNAISTDHSAILLSICTLPNTEKGPSHWRFNTSLLDDKDYVENIKLNIDLWKAEYTGKSSKTRWEFIKFKIREFTIKYSKKSKRI